MPDYNLFLKEVTLNQATIVGGGTAFEAIGKTTVDPTEPSAAKLLQDAVTGHKVEGKLDLTKGEGLELAEALTGGAKVIALAFHFWSVKTGAGRVKFGTATISGENTAGGKKWEKLNFSEAQAKSQTRKLLEEMVVLIETVANATWESSEIYVSIKTEAAASGVTIPLQAAASTSGASMALTAQTAVPLSPAASASTAAMALTAATTTSLSPAASTSGASLALSAQTQVPLSSANSASSATLTLTASTTVPLSAAASQSSASLGITAATQIPLAPGSSTSSASCTVTVPSGATIPLNPASSTSAASLTLKAATSIPLASAQSMSSATASLSARTTIPLAPASSESDATLRLTAATTIHLDPAQSTSGASCTVTIADPVIEAEPRISYAVSATLVMSYGTTTDERPAYAQADDLVYAYGGSE